MKIFSVDAETDGLYGKSFAIGAVVRQDQKEIARFQGRTQDPPRNEWCLKEAWPVCQSIENIYFDSDELEAAFWFFWRQHCDGATAIAHFGSPVESGLFRRCVEINPEERLFQGPYPLHEVGTALIAAGQDPESVDKFNRIHGLIVPFEGEPHHPLYDAMAAAVVWEALIR